MTRISRPLSTRGIAALGFCVTVLAGCGLGGGTAKKSVSTTSTTAAKGKATVPAATTASTTFATIPVPGSTTTTTLAPGATGAVVSVAPGGTPPNPGDKYIVKSGDVAGKIAAAMGVSLGALLDANGLTVKDYIKPGQLLVVPNGGLMPAGGTDPNGAPAGGTTQPTGLPTTTIPGSAGAIKYTIQSGDSWIGIASRTGVNRDQLLALNKATMDTVIHPGQTILIPAGGKIPATTAKPKVTTTVKPAATTAKPTATTAKATTTTKP